MKYNYCTNASSDNERRHHLLMNVIWDVASCNFLLVIIILSCDAFLPPANIVDYVYLISATGCAVLLILWALFMVKSDLSELKPLLGPKALKRGLSLILCSSFTLLCLAFLTAYFLAQH